jgi:DNA-binding CsgD family transcriptional regulator
MKTKFYSDKYATGLIAVITVQIFCAGFFAMDVIADFRVDGSVLSTHLYIETLAALALISAVVLEMRQLMQLLRNKAHLEDRVRQSEMTVHALIEENFSNWSLTPAEYDVAMFLFKGLSSADIAQIRGTSEGTVKAQLSSVYRKAGVQNRAELLMAIIDSLYAKESQHEADHPQIASQANG